MYWQEKAEEKSFEVTDEVLDLSFKIECKSLPLDHAQALSTTLLKVAPWLELAPNAAIHLIHGAESGNGWERPNNPEHDLLHLSRRARFTLRLNKNLVDKADELNGQTLNIDGHTLTIKEYKQQLLIPQTTIFSRYIQTKQEYSEDQFLDSIAPDIQKLGVRIRKMMGGKQHQIKTNNGFIITRSLMLSDLDKEDSIALQQSGIGALQLMGIGIFLPHKGISAVNEANQDIPSMPS